MSSRSCSTMLLSFVSVRSMFVLTFFTFAVFLQLFPSVLSVISIVLFRCMLDSRSGRDMLSG